jgi:hypothetical protein
MRGAGYIVKRNTQTASWVAQGRLEILVRFLLAKVYLSIQEEMPILQTRYS